MEKPERADAQGAPASATLMALKFELAMSIGESLELAPMVRRFMVPLLQAVQGLHCLLWLRADQGPALRLAYPQRSLQLWDSEPDRQAWLAQAVALQPPAPLQQSLGGHHRHALPVADEGWLFIERAGTAIHPAVLDAISVVLRRLARACRACHEHARARRLLAEKEAAERSMVEANARMAEIFSLSSDGFAYFDSQGQLAFCNPAVEGLLGLSIPQLMGLTLAELDRHLAACGDGSSAPALAACVAKLSGQASCSGLLSLLQPTRRVLAFTLSRTEGDNRAVLYLRDVTRETEVDRMKSEFLTTAAHELRTPMVSVFGFTELLLHRPVPEERRREVLQTIHRQASLLIKLVNELLDLARIEARQGTDLQREAVALGPLLQDAIDRLPQGAAPRHIDLSMAHEGAHLWVDPVKTGQALLNVLSNADKYSPIDRPIRISTHDGTRDGGPQGARTIGLRISDQGIGMSPEQQARVFERFYRADPSGNVPGTGLGMSLVKEIVELQGGQVELHSELGVGSTVTLWLPCVARSGHSGGP